MFEQESLLREENKVLMEQVDVEEMVIYFDIRSV